MCGHTAFQFEGKDGVYVFVAFQAGKGICYLRSSNFSTRIDSSFILHQRRIERVCCLVHAIV